MPRLFLLGAGFNADAASEVGASLAERDCSYPLTVDALRLCFDMADLHVTSSIEDLFSEAMERHDYEPISRLAHRLMKADYYLASRLAATQPNVYTDFFRRFDGSHLLTFNYDSLPEKLLYQVGRWYPHDGYGISVQADLLPWIEGEHSNKSSAVLVLHLHGSICIKTSEFHIVQESGSRMGWLKEREQPLFSFDPYSIGPLFAPYERPAGDFRIEERIIAPVRDKSRELARVFVRAVYDRAAHLVRSSGDLVSIGYSFNDHDHHSYDAILRSLGESVDKRLTVISPDARRLAAKLKTTYPSLAVDFVEGTFREWSCHGFPLD